MSHGHPIPSLSEVPFPLGGAFEGVEDTSDWLPGEGWTHQLRWSICPSTNAEICPSAYFCELICLVVEPPQWKVFVDPPISTNHLLILKKNAKKTPARNGRKSALKITPPYRSWYCKSPATKVVKPWSILMCIARFPYKPGGTLASHSSVTADHLTKSVPIASQSVTIHLQPPFG